MGNWLALGGVLAFFLLMGQWEHVQRRNKAREVQRKRLLAEAVAKDATIANYEGLVGTIAKLDEVNYLQAEFAAKDRQLAEAQRRAAEAEATVARLLDTRQLKT